MIPASLTEAEWAALTESERDQLTADLEDLAGGESLRDFMRRMAPHHTPPRHLDELIGAVEESRVNRLMKVGISMPPGHIKTTLFLNVFAWWLGKFPADTCAYNSYNAPQAYSKSVAARALAARAGVELSDEMNNKAEWRTTAGGGLLAGGMASLTGKRVQGPLVVDDPYSGPLDAFSPAYRESVWDNLMTVAMTRREGAPLFVVHCVARGEPILMGDGTWKAVETIRPGEMVAAFDGERFIQREVVAHRASGDDAILKVSTEKKSVRVNARHPFLLASKEWRKAGELKKGDRVVVSDAPYGEEDIDHERAWLFGFLMGDGWVTRWDRKNRDRARGKTYKTESLCICIATSVYPELNAKVLDAFERQFGRRPKPTRFGYVRADANDIGRRLLAMGLSGGAHGKRIPDWVFRLSAAGKRAYLRGHADADGCHLPRSTDAARIASVSRALINDLRLLAISAGIRCGRVCSFKQTVKAPNSAETSSYECFSVSINFASAPDRIETITEVARDGTAEVFDLTVAGAENFIAGGFVVHNTRWHEDDVIGRLRQHAKAGKVQGWRFINLPAINDAGEALWSEMYPVSALLATKADIGEYNFAALYQGTPRPRGGAVFGEPRYYDPATTDLTGCRFVLAADPAASEKTSADYSAAVVLALKGSGKDVTGYVLRVYRKQVAIPNFVDDLVSLQQSFGNTAINVESVGGFKAIPQMLRALNKNLRVKEIVPEGDKFTRAQRPAAAWNAGRLLVPSDSPPWLGAFLDEIAKFTGVKDKHDDQVDALAHAWNSGRSASIFDVI